MTSSGLRHAILAIAVVTGAVPGSGCAPAPRVVTTPTPRAADALAQADALVSAGCLDCLVEAYEIYSRAEPDRDVGQRAGAAATGAALLIAARERELGLEDSGALDRARSHLARLPGPVAEPLAFTLAVVETLPEGTLGSAITSDREVTRRATALRRRDEFRAFLETRADEAPIFAYTWLSFACAYRRAGDESLESVLQRASRWRELPLLQYRATTCRGGSLAGLQALLAAHPRLVELRYHAGHQSLLDGLVDEGIEQWQQAHAWRPRWPALTLALADAWLGIDEYEKALDYYERALALTAPPSALLGKARALTYLARHPEALAVIDELLALDGWYVGDARYWRALNLTQLERYTAAWDDIERASALMVGGDVAKLAGIIAHRLGRSEVARSRFEEAWRRNPADCEVGIHLSIVQSGLRAWTGALEALGQTAKCLEDAETQLQEEIARIRATVAAPARQAREVAQREERLATGKRLLATVWFNSAVAAYYSARMADARMFAERVVSDEEFGVRARTLLARIP